MAIPDRSVDVSSMLIISPDSPTPVQAEALALFLDDERISPEGRHEALQVIIKHAKKDTLTANATLEAFEEVLESRPAGDIQQGLVTSIHKIAGAENPEIATAGLHSLLRLTEAHPDTEADYLRKSAIFYLGVATRHADHQTAQTAFEKVEAMLLDPHSEDAVEARWAVGDGIASPHVDLAERSYELLSGIIGDESGRDATRAHALQSLCVRGSNPNPALAERVGVVFETHRSLLDKPAS
jgi:hypothetical protein